MEVTSPKTVRLALTKEEICMMLEFIAPAPIPVTLAKFGKLYDFLADLAQAPIYREGLQIDVTEPFAAPPEEDDVSREVLP